MISEEEFLMTKKRYQAIAKLSNINSYYDYEKTLIKYGRTMVERFLERSISEPSRDRRKKNLSRYGKIEINNTHPFSEKVNGFKISPYMQDEMIYIGQNDCYGDGHEVLSNLLGVSVNVMQLYRVTDFMVVY